MIVVISNRLVALSKPATMAPQGVGPNAVAEARRRRRRGGASVEADYDPRGRDCSGASTIASITSQWMGPITPMPMGVGTTWSLRQRAASMHDAVCARRRPTPADTRAWGGGGRGSG